MTLLISAAIMTCALTAAPDGQVTPEGTIPQMRATVSDEFAESVVRGLAPEPQITFVDRKSGDREWIVPMKQLSEDTLQVARITSMFSIDIKVGTAVLQEGNVWKFTEVSRGTCSLEKANEKTPEAGQ